MHKEIHIPNMMKQTLWTDVWHEVIDNKGNQIIIGQYLVILCFVFLI